MIALLVVILAGATLPMREPPPFAKVNARNFIVQAERGNPRLEFVEEDLSRPGDGCLDPPELCRHGAAIVVGEGSAARSPVLPDSFEQYAWIFVGRSTDGKRIWAIADSDVEAPGPSLEIAGSDDGGRTWRRLPPIHKPSYMAVFRDFLMGPDGTGGLRVTMGDEGGAAPGLYFYRTRDSGRHWSKPEFAANDVAPVEANSPQ